MNKLRFLSILTGAVGLFISIILIIYFSELIPILADYSEKNFSPDQKLGPGGIYNVKMVLFSAILFIVVLSLLFIMNLNLAEKFLKLLNHFIDIKALENLFLKDNLCRKKQIAKYIFIVATTLGIYAHFYLLTFRQPEWEGSAEEYISLLLLFTAVLLIISIFSLKRNNFTPNTKFKIIFLLIAIASLFIFIYGEEISWGQRIFGLDSPDFFDEYNTQTETNLHNFFNPLFLFAYPIVGIGSFILLFLIWFFPQKTNLKFYHLFIPHPSLFYLAFIMACASFLGENEMYEELVALFGFLYSIRIYMCLRFPSAELKLE